MYLPPPQITCVAQAVYSESRGESDLGKRATVHVIINRSKKFHKTPCEVLRQPGQFSYKFTRTHSSQAWRDAYEIAHHHGKDPTNGALYFKTKHCHVHWKYHITASIGNHNYYK